MNQLIVVSNQTSMVESDTVACVGGSEGYYRKNDKSELFWVRLSSLLSLVKGISTFYRMDRGSLIQPVDCLEKLDLHGRMFYRGVCGGQCRLRPQK